MFDKLKCFEVKLKRNNLVMGDPNFKPNINAGGKDRVLRQAELDYMKVIEQKNRERVLKLQQIARRNRITGVSIGAGVLGIYMYSIFAVKQETFLDDFEEPAKIQN